MLQRVAKSQPLKESAQMFDLADVCKDLKTTEEIMSAASQVLMCCSSTMMSDAVVSSRGSKRSAQSDDDEGSPPAAPAVDNRTPLQMAIGREWSL